MAKCCSSGRPADLWLCMWKYDGQIQVRMANWVKVVISIVRSIAMARREIGHVTNDRPLRGAIV